MRTTAFARVGLTFMSLLVLVLGLTLVVGTGEARAEGDLDWDTTLVYRLKDGSVNLVSDITVTNRVPNGREGNTIIQYYFDEIGIYIPVEAEGVTVTSGGQALGYEMVDSDEDAEGLQLVEIRLPRKLFYRRSSDVRLEYDISGDDPRTDSVFRVNPAYASFSVFAWGDPGRIEVQVVLDEAFDVEAFGSDYEISRDGSDVIYTMTDIEDPTEWFMHFTARNDANLDTETVTLGGHDVVVRAWPGDSFWSDEVAATVITGVPVLQELVSLEWRPEEDLVILESIEPTVLGYGGWYLEGSDLVEIGEFVDPHLVLHEVAHSWFNGDLFEERWITEGLADEFAATTVERLGEESEYWRVTRPVARSAPEAFALNEWPEPVDFDDEESLREEYGYATSWWLMHELAEEIGIDGLSAVIAAADADQIAYRGAGPAETVDPSDDWRRFLDLLQEVGGSENATELFIDWVLVDRDALAERTESRSSYDALLVAADGWVIPYVVRQPMSEWEFNEANVAIDDARQVIEQRETIESLAAEIGADAPDSLQASFESAADGLDEALALADDQVETAEDVVEAQESVYDHRNLLEVVGLIGEHPDEDLAAAIDAFEGDQLDDASAAAAELGRLMDDADNVGMSRLIKSGSALFGLALLIGGLVFWLVRRRREIVTSDAVD